MFLSALTHDDAFNIEVFSTLLLFFQYLRYKGLEKSASTFEKECSDKGAPIASSDVKPKASQKLAAVQVTMSLK